MNIVRLTTRIYPDKAGPAVYAFFLSKHVSGKKYKMFNVTCRPKEIHEKTKIINPNFKIDYLPITATRWDAKILKQLIFLLKFGFYSFKKLLKIHRKHRIDLIHCDNPAITGFIARIFNRIFKIPFIYTQHGLDSHFKLNFLLELKIIYPHSANYIIVSRRMKKFFEKNNVGTKKLIWIPIGVELKKFFHVKNKAEKKQTISDLNISSFVDLDDFVILYVGYMDLKQKVLGMIDFLHGFNKFLTRLVENQRRNVKLLYLGDGKYKNLLEKEIIQLKLNKNAHLLGIKIEIEKFYSISDFLALTSYMEGFPTVLLEATASNIPCICTDVGEVREILDKRCILPCGDRDEIAHKIQTFFEDKDLCDNIMESSLKKIQKFDWSYITEEIKNIYKKTILQ